MTVALALAVLISTAPAGDTGARIADAMAAEQGLQGSLDGAWALCDRAARELYRFELSDPAGRRGPLTGFFGQGAADAETKYPRTIGH